MTLWNSDMAAAPKDKTIIAAGNENVVTGSRWMAKEGRWLMFSKAAPPIAWQLWPEHPSQMEATALAAGVDVFE